MTAAFSAAFAAAMSELAQLSDARCAERWEWPGHTGWPLQVRDGLYRSFEEELAQFTAQPVPASEAARLLAVGQRAWGELRGLLLGLPEDILDEPPAAAEAGEWTLRQILEHVLLTERRYRLHVEYALSRSDSDPVRLELKVELSGAETAGGSRDWIERLAAERAAGAALGAATPEQLLRPTVWAGYAVDVRFRLLRFAGHVAEHTVQTEKLLEAIGWQSGEAHRIVRRISATRGAHELFTDPAVLDRLDREHAARAAVFRSTP